MIYNVVLTTAMQKWLSYTHTHIYSCFHIIFHYGLSVYSVMFPILYSRKLLFIHSMYIRLHMLISNSQSITLLPLTPLANTGLFSMFVLLILFHNYFHLYHILDFTYKWYHMIHVFLFLTRSIHVAVNGIIFPFYGWVVFHSTYVKHFQHPFICQQTFCLFPCFGYCE